MASTDIRSQGGAAGPSGVIHDIGYQRYTGRRLGRRAGDWALYVHSLRAAFGIGRGPKAKIFPWLIIGIALGFALIIIAVRSITEQPFLSYRQYATSMAYPVMMFLAITAPELVSRDLRDKVLPLYFSRPIGRTDYALTKLATLITAVLMLIALPQLFIYLGTVLSGDGWGIAWSELKDLAPGLVGAVIYALVLGSLSLLVASLSSRRAFAAAAVVAIFLISTPVVGIMFVIGTQTMQHLALLANPMTAVQGLLEWFFGSELGPQNGPHPIIGNTGPVYLAGVLVLVAAGITLLLVRYRKVAS